MPFIFHFQLPESLHAHPIPVPPLLPPTPWGHVLFYKAPIETRHREDGPLYKLEKLRACFLSFVLLWRPYADSKGGLPTPTDVTRCAQGGPPGLFSWTSGGCSDPVLIIVSRRFPNPNPLPREQLGETYRRQEC